MSKRRSPDRAAKNQQAPSVAELSPQELLGERLRRYSLGLTVALLTCRAYWPSEPDIRDGAGSGLTWILLLLVAVGLGVGASIARGVWTFRASWTDLAVVTLVCLIGLSATHAIDHRPAINLAWEWIALGIAYLLIRNLPRTRSESSAIAAALVATAVAVSVYGLYQVPVELPALRAEFLRNPQRVMEAAGVPPTPAAEVMFRSRLIGSNDVWSTFGLPNSLGGFLVGPMVICLGVILGNLAGPIWDGARLAALFRGLFPALAILICLILTKSRSSTIGLAVGTLILFWRFRHSVSRRVLTTLGIAGLLGVLLIIGAAWKAGRIDREVFTQSPMSLRYRLEYWQSTWGLLSEGASTISGAIKAPTFWRGVGPGNFGNLYLLYKLPQASEEVQDPHNMLLEVWATGGFFALLALIAALYLGGRAALGAPSFDPTDEPDRVTNKPGSRSSEQGGVGWLIACAAAGWVLVVVLGQLNPFVGDLFIRWLLLGAGWLCAVLLGWSLWVGTTLSATTVGAGAIALMINLLAVGGIGIPTVALSLWTMLAVAQNLRDDRPCGVLRSFEGRTPGLVASGVWAAVVGSFLGSVVPFWNSDAAMASADRAIHAITGPNYQGAEAALLQAIKADPFDARPHRKMAGVEMQAWQERGARPEDDRWQRVPIALKTAVTLPRNPQNWSLHAERADIMRAILARVGGSIKETDRLRYLANIVEATRTASLLYPNNATLRAKLALASADMSMFTDAAHEGDEALRLDGLMPHEDKKLPTPLRKQIEENLSTWKKRAAEMPIGTSR